MAGLSSIVLSLNSSTARLAWLRQNHPTVNPTLIDELRREVQQTGTLDTQSVLKIAQFVADAASLWKDEQTRASALRIEAEAIRYDNPESALQKYREAVSIYKDIDLLSQAADAALGIVATLIALGMYADATSECEQIIAEFTAMKDLYGLGRAYTNLGILNSMQGNFGIAQQNYKDARNSFLELGDTHWLAIVDINEANVLEELKQFNDAKSKYLRAQSYFVEIESIEMALKVEHNLAYLYFSLGEYQKALQLFTEVGQRFGERESSRNEAMADLYRSEVYIALNQWERALIVLKKVQPVFEEAQMVWELGQVQINQAISLANMNRYAEAFECCDEARHSMADDENNQIWIGLVDLYQSIISMQAGQIDDAANLAQRSADRFAQLGIHYRLAQSQQILGEIALVEADFQSAEEQFTQALAIAEEHSLSVLLYGCHHGLGKISKHRHDIKKAQRHYQEAVNALERLQGLIGAEDYKISYRSDKLKIYHEYVELCLSEDDFNIQKAFEIIERSRARTLLDSLVNSTYTNRKTSESSGSDANTRQLREELNWYYRQLFTPDEPLESVNAISALNEAIAERESRLTEHIKAAQNLDSLEVWNQNISVLNVAEIRKQLPSQTTVLSYFVMEQSLILFLVNQEEFRTLRIDLAEESLTEILNQFRFQLDRFQISRSLGDQFTRSLIGSINHVLAQLYDLLIRPIIDTIDEESHLVLVPYGPLHSVPFHALYDGSEYLIQKYSVSYAPSATFFCLLTGRDAKSKLEELAEPLLFGLNDELINQAEIEAHTIGQFFPEADVFSGEQFLSKQLLSNDKFRSFIHLATHGNIRQRYPKLSALKSSDGWITLYDIEQMNQTAKLITLSACDTGQNAIQSGDELIGFYKSFFATGASTLVLSLWPLHDETTVEFMKKFYSSISKEQQVSTALREAQLAFLQTDYPHPFYWAPFFVVGDPFTRI